jgi:hypothetical protein
MEWKAQRILDASKRMTCIKIETALRFHTTSRNDGAARHSMPATLLTSRLGGSCNGSPAEATEQQSRWLVYQSCWIQAHFADNAALSTNVSQQNCLATDGNLAEDLLNIVIHHEKHVGQEFSAAAKSLELRSQGPVLGRSLGKQGICADMMFERDRGSIWILACIGAFRIPVGLHPTSSYPP